MKIRRRNNRNINIGSGCDKDVQYECPDYFLIRVYRILCDLRGYRELIQGFGFQDDRIAEVIGLSKWIYSDRHEFKHTSTLIIAEPHKNYDSAVENLDLTMSCGTISAI